jgi:transglutaminase-like putative cysteine protease
MADLLLRFINRFQPREGWAVFLLILTTFLCLPAALLETNDEIGATGLFALTILALILGRKLGYGRTRARDATILGSVLGLGLSIITVGRLLPPFSLLWADIGHLVAWLNHQLAGTASPPTPFASTVQFSWQQFNALSLRLGWWRQSVANTEAAQDVIFSLLLLTFATWMLSLFASWQICRHKAPLIGLLPSCTVIAIAAFFHAGMNNFYLFTHLFCMLWLLAICHLRSQWARWERAGTDFPGSLGMEMVLFLSPWLIGLILLASFCPMLYSNQIREAFEDLTKAPWSRMEETAERFLGPIESGYSGGRSAYAGSAGGMPRSHLLGAGPELGESITLFVSISDPPPPRPEPGEFKDVGQASPARYWRGATYDIYTGAGWLSSPLEVRPLSSNQLLDTSLPAGQDLLQQYHLLVPSTQVYAANAPVRAAQTVQAWLRTHQDLAQLTGEADDYTILSRTPTPSVTELRALSAISLTLAPDLAERYLDLPETVPKRVFDLANMVAGSAPTRYDRARAIETYLRTYPYNLDLPRPPADRDLVDYFLFDLQQGYCDYYASAMVIMARAVGVPARLATGYAQGTYDYDQGHWVVTEQDSHSWVEVYFDQIGWIEFEPTAGRPALNRPGGELTEIQVPPLPSRPIRWWQQVPWTLVGIGVLLFVLLAAIIRLWRPSRPADAVAVELIRDHHARLLGWGKRLGHPLQDGQTPQEYGASLGGALHAQGQDTRWPRIRRASSESRPQIEQLSAAFTRAQYSPHPISEGEGWKVQRQWSKLRHHLWWLWLSCRWKRQR